MDNIGFGSPPTYPSLNQLVFVIDLSLQSKGKYYENDFDAVKKLLSSFTDTNLYAVNWCSLFLLMMFTHRASKGRLAETILIDS